MPIKFRWEPHGAMIIPSGVVTADEVFKELSLARDWIGLPHPDDNDDNASGLSDQNRITLPKDPE